MIMLNVARVGLVSLILGLPFLFSAPEVKAQTITPEVPVTTAAPVVPTTTVPDATLFSSTLEKASSFAAISADFMGMVDATAADLGGDGTDELIVAYGFQGRPEIKIYRGDGSLINSFFPYGVGYEGKVAVTAGDLNGDGTDEIITATGEGGGPHIRMFNAQGEALYDGGFFAYDISYRRGMDVAAGDLNNDGRDEIVVSLAGDNVMIVRIFNGFGDQVMKAIEKPANALYEPHHVAVADMNGNGVADIVTSAGFNEKPLVVVYGADGVELSRFMAYAEAIKTGVQIAVTKIGEEAVIITAPSAGAKGHVRVLTAKGEMRLQPSFFPFGKTTTNGMVPVVGSFGTNGWLWVLPQTAMATDLSGFGKIILVDLSEQRLYAYNRGKLDKTFLISSGLRRFPTPVGMFSVYRKRPVTRMAGYYGAGSPDNYDLPNVRWAMSFYGAYNLHGTYWHSNFGHPMSHGCVNISNTNAGWLYQWSPMGTPVKVQY